MKQEVQAAEIAIAVAATWSSFKTLSNTLEALIPISLQDFL